MAPWSELTGLVVTRYYTPSSLLQNVLIFIWMLLYYMPASNGRHILPLSSLTLIPIPQILSQQPGRDNDGIQPFIPPSPSSEEKWVLSKYPFRGARVRSEVWVWV